jgi:hypothetical protein
MQLGKARTQLMKVIVTHSVMLTDMNSQHLCEFMMMKHPDEPSNPWVKCIPSYGMFIMTQKDVGNPIIVQPGMTMPDTSFLGYIANVANQGKQESYPYTMINQGGNKFARVILSQGMLASDIADLTGFDLEKVRLFYRNYFVVDVDGKATGE